jgi:HK97 family phage portal protein
MAFWNRKKAQQPEQRSSIEDPNVPISSRNILELFGLDSMSIEGITVNEDTAMGIPAIWAAVNFISGTIAGLPLHLYRKTESGRERVEGGLATILHDAVNDEMSSFEWRKYCFERTLTGGRSITFIERNAMGRIINLWPLDPSKVTITKRSGKKTYTYEENGEKIRYSAAEIIDIPFSLKADMVTSRSPIASNQDTISLGIAATKYGSKLFQNGGVPPFAITGQFQSGAAMKRASDDLQSAVKKASKENRLALTLPANHEIKSLGIDPEKSQLVELKRFLIEEYARIYSLPPVFLQDLSHGTFSNTEQQDLHFVKHTIKRWIEQTEQELNLKLFGKDKTSQYVEFNLDGLLRGDFATRMQGYATAIQNAILTPNEARRLENRPEDPQGNDLLIQGATVPLGSQPIQEPNQPAPAEEDDGA